MIITTDHIPLDYTIKDPALRVQKVNEIIAATPPEKLTPFYLGKLSNYIIDASIEQEKDANKKREILTDNRLVTINKYEVSLEGALDNIENGSEDAFYQNVIEQDKSVKLTKKKEITEKDIQEIEPLRELREEIARVEELRKTARGKKAYNLKKQVIEMSKDQYVIKNDYNKPIRSTRNLLKSLTKSDLTDKIIIAGGEPANLGNISLFNPDHISLLLCNYSTLKEDSWDKVDNDMRWELIDLEKIADAALKQQHPLYYDLMIYKIDGLSNAEIQQLLYEKYNIRNSVEYLSSLWRNKIPKLIAEEAIQQYLEWHYTFQEKGQWKKCSRCGQIKLVNQHFFSKNKTSKDGFYSICKCCRNKKGSD